MLGLLGKIGSTVVTGAIGAAAWDGVKKVAESGAAREGAVVATAWGIKGKRHLEVGAERVRLTTGDIVAEARQRVGEQVPPPGVDLDGHDHEH